MAHVSIQSTHGIGLVERTGAFLQRLRKAWDEHSMAIRTYNELNALSDRELADLGLHRSNIRQVAQDAIKRD